jgi:hypothetical protein
MFGKKLSIGDIFGNRKVIEVLGVKNKTRYYKVMCKCGRKDIITKQNFTQHGICRTCKYIDESKDGSFNSLYYIYKKGSGYKNRIFNLTKEQFSNLTKSKCYYCGKEPSQIKKCNKYTTIPYIYNGIDRLNNAIGYEIDNCVPCCKRCNFAKARLSYKDFITMCKEVVAHHS